MAAKDQTIAAYEQIDRLRQAQADSEQARMRADQLVIVLLTMLGRLFAKISDLTKDRNRLLAERSPDFLALTAVENRLREAEAHRKGTEETVRLARQERDEALRVADRARRAVCQLQDELDQMRARQTDLAHIRAVGGELGRDQADDDTTGFPSPPGPDQVFLHDYAEALRKARAVLDTGSDALHAAEEQITLAAAASPQDAGKMVPGTVLSRTTPDNRMTGADKAFDDRYREYVSQRHANLSIYGVNLGRTRHAHWPLDVAYLSLELASPSSGPEQSIGLDTLPADGPGGAVERVEQALAGRQRTVVMGPAGSGKSTLLQWLAVNAARQTLPDRLGYLNGYVPFILSLRSLAHRDAFPGPEELLAATGCPLADLQPRGWADRVLEHGRALVLVDGVDEIPPARRSETQEWLQHMLAAHPRGCYVITTRSASVPDSWLDSVGFRHLMLQPMNRADVRRFISFWHAAARVIEDDKERRVLEVLEEVLQHETRQQRNLSALASTPLLCALLCALNRDRCGYLPSAQMSFYDAALSMLLDRRDVERGISVVEGIRISQHESMHLLQALAYWLIRNSRYETDQATAVQVLRPVLAAMPALVGQGSAEQVLRHLLVRSGLLREPAAGSVEFIHRSFRDYLGARAAVEAADFGLLVINAHEAQWENVVLLAAGHARPAECARLLTKLVLRGDREDRYRVQLHRLAESCLEYATELDPKVQETVRQLAAALDPPQAT